MFDCTVQIPMCKITQPEAVAKLPSAQKKRGADVFIQAKVAKTSERTTASRSCGHWGQMKKLNSS